MTRENSSFFSGISTPGQSLTLSEKIKFCAACLLACAPLAVSNAAGQDLGLLSLDELLELEAVSAAKVPEKASDTPAAITIITQEDLRRNGVQSIPEALRMVPGMHVYQIDANKWAVSARGFASRFANKMLVMIDGRTVYSNLFSGVFWDVQDMVLEDVDRIEVIRGPGGTLWGANAVNGVINIISKDSADTQGSLVALQGGTVKHGEGNARYGGWLNDRTSYRVYGKYFTRGAYELPDGEDAHDDWQQYRGGFRMDSNLSPSSKATLQGDIYDGKSGEAIRYLTPYPPFDNMEFYDASVSGGNLLGRWSKTFSKKSELIFQAYFDHTRREESFIDETTSTLDFDLQHRFMAGEMLEVLYGFGYRYNNSDTKGKEVVPSLYSYMMDPREREDDLFSGFLQARLPFAGNKAELTVGTKLEYNDYTGFEYQPSARFLWSPVKGHSLWGAVSRTVRTPSRIERDAVVNAGAILLPPEQGGYYTFIRLQGDDALESETMNAYEAGYRGRLGPDILLDVALYYNRYDDLVATTLRGMPSLEMGAFGPSLIIPIQVANGRNAEAYGAEISCSWSVRDWWRLTGGLTLSRFSILDEQGTLEARQGFDEDENADHMFSLISYMDLPHAVSLNSAVYYVGSLEGPSDITVDSHLRFDLNLEWQMRENIMLAGGVHNLFDSGHMEFTPTMDGIQATEIPRTVYAKMVLSF